MSSVTEVALLLKINEMEEQAQALQRIAYQLVKKLGGTVELSSEEMQDPEMAGLNLVVNRRTGKVIVKSYTVAEADIQQEDSSKMRETMEAEESAFEDALQNASDVFAGLDPDEHTSHTKH